MPTDRLTLADVLAAAAAIRGQADGTPLVPSQIPGLGQEMLLKLETMAAPLPMPRANAGCGQWSACRLWCPRPRLPEFAPLVPRCGSLAAHKMTRPKKAGALLWPRDLWKFPPLTMREGSPGKALTGWKSC